MTPVRKQFQAISLWALLATAVLAAMGSTYAEQGPVGDEAPAPAQTGVVLSSDDDVSVMPEIEFDAVDAELDLLSESLLQQRRQGRAAQALQTANQIVAFIEKQYGTGVQLVEPMSNVVELQLELGDGAAAEQTLGRLVGLIETKDSVFSTDLVEPLTALAGLYSGSDRLEDAVTLLRRARHITHRQLGILNMEQIELAERLADGYFRLGQIDEGTRENRFVYRVNIREFGEDSAELVPAINTLAAWYERIGEFTAARQYYKRSIELIEKDYGVDDLRLVDTLHRIAGTYQRQRVYKGDGHDSLIRAVEIHEKHPEADEIAHANALTELGDWSMSTARTAKAMELYNRAWNLLTGDGANPERGDIIFGKPHRVRYDPPLPSPYRMMSLPEVYVDVEFIVTSEGTIKEVTVIDSTADWRTQSEVKTAMRHARFRPRLVDGQPVAAKISTRWTYRVPRHLRRPAPAADATEEPDQNPDRG